MDVGLFESTIVLLCIAVITTIFLKRFQLPILLGYIIAGILCGPQILGRLQIGSDIQKFAEFGIVFLLFTIGLEFSLPRIRAMRSTVFIYGGLQVSLTILITTIVGLFFGLKLSEAVILSGVVTMSSTAIVMKQLSEQMELNLSHGSNAMGILLFQDLAVIPFLILITSLAGKMGAPLFYAVPWAVLKGMFAIGLILSAGRWILKPFFNGIAAAKSTELFTLATLLVALGSAWLTYTLGLSLTLGAFLAGIMLAETEFRHQLSAEMRPFRDILLGLFFITIGMQFDMHIILNAWPWVLLLFSALVIFKMILITLLGIFMHHNKTTAFRTGLVLSQGSEFGFAILFLASNYRLLPDEYAHVAMAALLMSMAISTLLIRYSKVIADKIFPKSYLYSPLLDTYNSKKTHEISHHVVICGFGKVGRHVANLLTYKNIPYIALDLNPKSVRKALLNDENAIYGDATHPALLDTAGLEKAKAVIVTFCHKEAAEKIAQHTKNTNPHAPIIFRDYLGDEIEMLMEKGVTTVVPEILEVSLALSNQLLMAIGMPPNEVLDFLSLAKDKRYKLIRDMERRHDIQV